MRTFVLLPLLLGLIFFTVGGYVALQLGWLSERIASFYQEHFTFATGLASILGLLAFASSRKIKSTDFASEELEKLKGLLAAAEALETIERNKSKTEQQISELERKKKLMEVSVRKAGLALFYREQYNKYSTVVGSKIEADSELKEALKETIEARARLRAVREEIEEDENVAIIKDILKEKEPEYAESLTSSPFISGLQRAADVIANIMIR